MSAADRLQSILEATNRPVVRKLEQGLALYGLYKVMKALYTAGPSGVKKGVMGYVLAVVRRVPGLASKVAEEEEQLFEELERDHLKIVADPRAHVSLPIVGASADEVIAECKGLRAKETEFVHGKAHGGIYYSAEDEDLIRVHKEVMSMFLSSNLLFPGVFVSSRKFEAEVVRMLCAMVHADAVGGCGALTSGGTESILMAVKAYRDQATALLGITEPEIVAGNTAHPALDKACHYLGVKLIKVPVTSATGFKLTVADVAKHVNRRTIAIYASAPTFSHGVVDDIEGLASFTESKRIGLHVDNCLGGFVLSHLRLAGKFAREFDFTLAGVTSMSVDVHKFGYSPKGVSCVVYRSPELRRFQYHSTVDFSGGLYTTPTMQGSRSGAVVAAAWATMVHIGQSGYLERAKRYAAVTDRLVAGLAALPGIQLLAQPDAAIVSFTSDKYSIYALVDRVSKNGWELAGIQNPPGAAIRLGERMLHDVDALLADIAAAAQYCSEHPTEPAKGATAAMYGNNTMLPASEMEAALSKYLDLLYKVKTA